jgi:hypothetical protein
LTLHAPEKMRNGRRLKASSIAKLAHEKREEARLAKIAEELHRIEEDRKRTASGKRKVGEITLSDGGHTRVVKKYLTTLDQLERRGQLPRELRVAFDAFAAAAAASTGACVDERDRRNGSSRGIAAMEPAAGGGFGPRGMSDATLRAQRLSQYVWGIIPEGMMRLARHLIEEETGYTMLKPPPLTEYGNANNFHQEQQARASGATMAIDLCRVIHHALKSR